MKYTGLRILFAIAWFYIGFYTADFALHAGLRIMAWACAQGTPHWTIVIATLDSTVFAAALFLLALKGYFPIPRLLFSESFATKTGIIDTLQRACGVAAVFVVGVIAHIFYFVLTDTHTETIAKLKENTRARTEQILNANGQNLIDAMHPNATFTSVTVRDVSLSKTEGRGVTWAFSTAFYWKTDGIVNGRTETIIYRTQERFDGVKLARANGAMKDDWEPAVLALLEYEFPHSSSIN